MNGQYGELIAITNPDDTEVDMSEGYDANLRLVQKLITFGENSPAEGTTKEVFGYDDSNRMNLAENYKTVDEEYVLISQATMTYDSLGNKLGESLKIGVSGDTKNVVSTYNELSFRDSLTYPGGTAISYEDRRGTQYLIKYKFP